MVKPIKVEGEAVEATDGTGVSTDSGSIPNEILKGTTTYVKTAFGIWVPDYIVSKV